MLFIHAYEIDVLSHRYDMTHFQTDLCKTMYVTPSRIQPSFATSILGGGHMAYVVRDSFPSMYHTQNFSPIPATHLHTSNYCMCGVHDHGFVHTLTCMVFWKTSGLWFNIKMSSYQYRKSHCEDKMVVRSSMMILRPSYPHNDQAAHMEEWLTSTCQTVWDRLFEVYSEDSVISMSS